METNGECGYLFYYVLKISEKNMLGYNINELGKFIGNIAGHS